MNQLGEIQNGFPLSLTCHDLHFSSALCQNGFNYIGAIGPPKCNQVRLRDGEGVPIIVFKPAPGRQNSICSRAYSPRSCNIRCVISSSIAPPYCGFVNRCIATYSIARMTRKINEWIPFLQLSGITFPSQTHSNLNTSINPVFS